MKTLNIDLEDTEYEALNKEKERRGLTWKQWLFTPLNKPLNDPIQKRFIEIMDSLTRVQKELEARAMQKLNEPEPKQPGIA